jgi:hypothetical protein
MTDKEFDILWRLAYGTSPVPVDEASKFKELAGVDDGMYLTNREEKNQAYYRTADSKFWCIND